MRKTALALLFLLAAASFSLSVTAAAKDGEIMFTVDGKHYESTNLTLFLFMDGTQIRGVQKNGVNLPYYFYAPYNSTSVYELRVVSNANEYANTAISVTVPASAAQARAQQQEEQSGMEAAVVVAFAGLLILAYLLVSFIKVRSDSK